MLKRLHDTAAGQDTALALSQVDSLAPFTYGLEYSAPARGGWTIVHIGMLLPESHQVFVCAQSCLRGVVLSAAELGDSSRFLPYPWMRIRCWRETARRSSLRE